MWAENARGHNFGVDALADLVGVSDSPAPMNMNKETGAKLLGKKPDDPNPTPAQIGSVWNFTGREQTNDFGEFIQRLFDEKPWRKNRYEKTGDN